MSEIKFNEITYNNVNIEDMVKKLTEERNKILDTFSKAYLAETGLLPSEVELVSKQETKDKVIETVYYFRRKV